MGKPNAKPYHSSSSQAKIHYSQTQSQESNLNHFALVLDPQYLIIIIITCPITKHKASKTFEYNNLMFSPNPSDSLLFKCS